MRTRGRQRNWLKMSAAGVAGLVCAHQASAVIVLQSESRNLGAPTGSLATPFALQGQLGLFNATPISPTQLIAAKHIGAGTGTQFTYGTQIYTVATFTDIPGTDLRVLKIDTQGGTRSFSSYASVWNPSVDGSEAGRPLVVFGRGTARGEAIYAPINPGYIATSVPHTNIVLTGGESTGARLTGPTPAGQGDLRGWKLGASDSLASWGQNKVEFTLTDPDYGQLLGFNFDNGAATVPNEAILSRGDSSGGVFAQNNAGQWKLIGVNLGVDGSWSFTKSGPYFEAALFDARGLWVGDATNNQYLPYGNTDLAASSYASRVSSYYSQLSTITNNFTNVIGGGDVPMVPEPATLGIALAGLVACARKRRDA